MDETIGTKGTGNDRKRSLIITRERKKKLAEQEKDQELKDLEKEVKRKQIYTLVKTLPIATLGGTFKYLYDVGTGKKRTDIEEENSKWRIKEYDADITTKTRYEDYKKKKIIKTPTGERIIVYVEPTFEEEHHEEKKTTLKEKKEESPVEVTLEVKTKEKDKDKSKTTKPTTTLKPKGIGVIEEDEKQIEEMPPVKGTTPLEQNSVSPSEQIGISHKEEKEIKTQQEPSLSDAKISVLDFYQDIIDEFGNVDEEVSEKISKLETRKIIDEYERQLKDIRYDLRNTIYEYNVLASESDDIVFSKEAEIILDKLSDIIDRIQKLKERIRIDDLDRYDDNYIYTLIEGYLREFKEGNTIKQIKDSPLYVEISKKLDELDKKRDELDKKVSNKKDNLEEKEKDFENLKSKYYSIDRINKELLTFQNEQDQYLKEIQEKVKNAESVSEKVETQVVGLSRQSKRLMRFLTLQMFLPGPKYAKSFAATTAAYLYFYNNLMKPNTVTKKYRVITVNDYHSDIVNSISSIDNATALLGRTSKQVEKMIREVEEQFADYIGVLPECDTLLSNLRKIKSEIKEKEYEMQRIKRAQELELEKNDAKVLTKGQYPVN